MVCSTYSVAKLFLSKCNRQKNQQKVNYVVSYKLCDYDLYTEWSTLDVRHTAAVIAMNNSHHNYFISLLPLV